MLAGLLSLRNYLIVSAVVAILLFAIQTLFGPTFVTGLTNINRAARAAGMAQILADGITEPIKAVVTPNSPVGAIAGGLAWPLLAVWFLLLFALIFFTVLGRGLGQAGRAIST